MKKKLLLSLSVLSLNSVYAASPIQGNPLDTIPTINLEEKNTTQIHIEKKAPELNEPKGETIQVKEFKIQGVKSVDFKQVAAIFTPLTNKPITIQELINAGNQVTELYKKAGYPLSFGYIPQQNLTTGVIQVVAVEGYVKDVSVKGKLDNNEKRIREIVAPLVNEKPLSQKTFERVANVLSLQPGIKVNLNITPPSNIEGGTTLDAEIVQKKVDVSVGVEFKNPGMRALLVGSVNSLTPLGDQLTFSTLQPGGRDHVKFYSLGYTVPLSSNGLIGKVSASSYQEEPSLDYLSSLGYNNKYKNKTDRLSFAASYPIILDNTHNWTVTGGFYLNNETQTYSPMSNIYSDLNISTHLRVLYGETTYLTVSPNQSRLLGLSLYKGLNSFGASSQNNIDDVSFFKVKLQANQNYNLTKATELRLAGVYQYSPDNLANSERISFGNRAFGAGYQAGEIAGDKGWGVSAEVNHTFTTNYKYLTSIQPYVSVDNSKISFNKISSQHTHLSSVSLGARLTNKTSYNLDISLAKPIGDRPINDADRSLRLNLLYSYQFQ